MNEKVPDIYTDGVSVGLSPFDAVLQFTLRNSINIAENPQQAMKPEPIAFVRMSLEHAKVAAILLRKVLKQHEDQQNAKIPIHPSVCQSLGISPNEDW